jgi:primosomal protein N' (replication factor Y)
VGASRQGRRPEVGPRPLSDPGRRVVRVLPDEPAINKTFDYSVPDDLAADVRIGTMVRVALHGRRVGGWVVADEVTAPPDVRVRDLAKVSGWGPAADVIDLATWASWRWAGRPASFLRTASPPRVVRSLPRPAGDGGPSSPSPPAEPPDASAYDHPRSVVRVAPTADPTRLVLAAAARGNALVLTPSVAAARALGLALRRAGVTVAIMDRDWASAAAGAVVVGSRAAAWAPVVDLAAVVVLDEHDESYQEERAPTWHARDVAAERARRAGVPCVLVSPTPTLEALDWGRLVTPSRTDERAGWPLVDVVDRRKEDVTRGGLYSDGLVRALRGGGRIVCVLNRTGRSRLLACASCGELARCERCDASVTQGDDGELRCRRCDTTRPAVCAECGATRLKNLRVGIGRAREELEALAGEPVVEVSASSDDRLPDSRIYVGTEAVLHRVPDARVVAFLDFDQELLAPRYRVAEQAMALLVRAARLLGPRDRGGRLLIQTRLPRNEVITAALHADPGRLVVVERERRQALGFPPYAALAEVSGEAAATYVESLGQPLGLTVLGPADGRWLVRAQDHQTLCEALAATTRPPGRLRVAVDPLRV